MQTRKISFNGREYALVRQPRKAASPCEGCGLVSVDCDEVGDSGGCTNGGFHVWRETLRSRIRRWWKANVDDDDPWDDESHAAPRYARQARDEEPR